MQAKTYSKYRATRVRVPLSSHVSATLDRRDDLLAIKCKTSGLTVMLLLTPDTEACFRVKRGCLSIGAWMAVDIACTPEQALELVAAIGPRGLPRFAFTD